MSAASLETLASQAPQDELLDVTLLCATETRAFEFAHKSSVGQIGHLATSLPWSVAEYDRLRAVMGEDFWSYGVEQNRHVLETLARYSHDQNLSVRQLPIEEMFVASTFDLSKI